MTKEDFAEILSSQTSHFELSHDQEIIAKENDLVVIYGKGERDLKFRGALNYDYKELNRYLGEFWLLIAVPGMTIPKEEGGIIEKIIELQVYPLNKYQREQIFNNEIFAFWKGNELWHDTWDFHTQVPQAKFGIYSKSKYKPNDEENFYCRGIVISLQDNDIKYLKPCQYD